MIDKIRKLLALANNNPNEQEAARAMEKATELMMQHGIDESQLKQHEAPKVVKGQYRTYKDQWEVICASAVALMMGVRPVMMKSHKQVAFWGRAENIAAAEAIYTFITAQVESYYKEALPSGMSQAERSQFRKSFKWSCASRVYQRAADLVAAPQASTGSTALVVSHRQTLEDELDDFSSKEGLSRGRPSKCRISHMQGALLGQIAGQRVNINRGVN